MGPAAPARVARGRAAARLTAVNREDFAQLLDEKLEGLGRRLEQRLDQKLEAFEQRLDQKLEARLDQKLAELEQRFDEKLDGKLEVTLQPLWQAMNSLNGRMTRLEEKVDALTEQVTQVKFDTAKQRPLGTCQRV